MARIDNINNFLTDVANSIRNKTGKTDNIPASEFDVEIESISGGGSEDLTEELNDYSAKLETQKTSISSITEALAGKAGGSGRVLNLFLQENEPLLKKGLWLQTNKTYNNTMIIETDGVPMTFATEKASTTYPYNNGVCQKVGDYVYLLGGGTNWASEGCYMYAYKYHIPSNAMSRLKNTTPRYIGYSGSTVAGGKIYFFCVWDYYAFRVYNPQTDAYAQLANPPVYYTCGANLVTLDDNTLYHFGNDRSGSTGLKSAKYNISTNTWTAIADLPSLMPRCVTFVSGTDVYILGGPKVSGSPVSYKYDTLRDAYTTLNTPPTTFSSSSWYYNDTTKKAYIFSPNDDILGVYEYDISTDSYTKMNVVLPYSFVTSGNGVVEYNGNLLMFGGNGGVSKVAGITLDIPVINPPKNTDNAIVYINKNNAEGDHACELFNTNKISTDISKYNTFYVNDLFHRDRNGVTDNSSPAYYGNGEEWIKFKN